MEIKKIDRRVGSEHPDLVGRVTGRNESGDYRYGFNGMESDDEVFGDGNSYSTEFRQYDPRIGRWLSLDPLLAKYPQQSPYVAFNNNPIYFSDPSGGEGEPEIVPMSGQPTKTTGDEIIIYIKNLTEPYYEGQTIKFVFEPEIITNVFGEEITIAGDEWEYVYDGYKWHYQWQIGMNKGSNSVYIEQAPIEQKFKEASTGFGFTSTTDNVAEKAIEDAEGLANNLISLADNKIDGLDEDSEVIDILFTINENLDDDIEKEIIKIIGTYYKTNRPGVVVNYNIGPGTKEEDKSHLIGGVNIYYKKPI